jgi:hypothetical protein
VCDDVLLAARLACSLNQLLPLFCCCADYNHSLEGFVMDGLRVTRCPGTQMMRVSSARDHSSVHMQEAAASAGTAGSMRGVGATVGAMAVDCGTMVPASLCALRKTCSSSDEDAGGDTFPIVSCPSELVTSINNINLAESIAKHKQWTQPGDAAGNGSADGSSMPAKGQVQPALQVSAVAAAAAEC